MGLIVIENPQILINSVDLSNHVDSVSIDVTFAAVDTTAFGATAKSYAGGLGDNKIQLEFLQDMAIGSVEQTIWPLLGGTTSFSVSEINPSQLTAGTSTNPTYTGTILLDDWHPVSGKVGELQKSSVTWPISGNILKNGVALT